MIEINKIYNMDNLEGMKLMEDNSIDLTITSPPYDELRDYTGFSWNFESLAKELFRITKVGGVVVWVVGDATINGSETGTSFEQALFFKKIGFNLHDTMIWKKHTFTAVGALKYRYAPIFDYMFVFSKGKLKTFNPIKDRPNKWAGTNVHGTVRQKNGTSKPVSNNRPIAEFGQRYNIWEMSNVGNKNQKHPATFPEILVKDHILSWSNKGDLIFDPFLGSGTTCKVAKDMNRQFIGFEISKEYFEISKTRIER